MMLCAWCIGISTAMGGKMILTRIRKEDLPLLFLARNNEDIFKWSRQYDVLHYQNHADWFERQSKDPRLSMYAIRRDEHDEIVGVCGLSDIDFRVRRAEFSIYVFPERQSDGFGTKALKALLEKGFNSYNLNVIWGETFDGNPATRLWEKVGMQKEGTRRQFYYQKGEYIDAHLYSITRDEWKKSL